MRVSRRQEYPGDTSLLCTTKEATPSYLRCLRHLKKKYAHVEKDIGAALFEIENDCLMACNATAIPGYSQKLWKYRCGSTDMGRGRRGGFRIIAYIDHSRQTLYPLLVYAKTEQEDASAEQFKKTIAELGEMLRHEKGLFE